MSITSKEIAMICGVSRGTVDRALHNRPGLKESTKKMILKVAEEHGYYANHIGRSLVTGKSWSIGVILIDINNRIFAQLINGIDYRARDLKYIVNLSITNRDHALEFDTIRQHLARNVDGIILLSVNDDPKFIDFLHKQKKPIVAIGNKISPSIPHVWIDDTQAINDMMCLLVKKGYEQIIYVSPPLKRMGKENLYVPMQRYTAFINFVEKHKIGYQTFFGQNYIQEILNSDFKNKKTAVLCSSDMYAINIVNTLKDLSIKVPEQIGVAGFDNIDILKYFTPKLATVGYYAENIGAEAMNCIYRMIDNQVVPVSNLLQHYVVEGDSL